MLLLEKNDLENRGSTWIIAVALFGIISVIGIEGTIYNNPRVSAVDNNNISYTMEFIENTVGNMPDNILDGLAAGASSLIPPNNPIRSGFKFAGWCDQATTKSGNSDTCATGHSHQPGDTISLNQTGTNNIKLYAMWEEICAGYTTMQGLTSSSIATLLPNEHSTATVCDVRDDQTYTIAKLKDGRYWMVENLNLAGGTALSADDTDVTSAYISSFSTSNNLTKTGNTIVLPASSTSGFSFTNNANYSYVYNSGNKTDCGASGQDTPCYSYYSWDAATLGSGRNIGTDNANAPYSICPKGWKLPSVYNGSGEVAGATDFRALMIGYGGSNSIQNYNSSTTPTGAIMYGNIGPGTTPNFRLAGLYVDSSFYLGGSRGYSWSSTSNSYTSGARYLSFDDSSVYSAESMYRYYGFSVRCLFSGQ